MAFRDSINDLMYRFYERFKQNNNRLPVSVEADINVGDVQIGTVKQGAKDDGAEPWDVALQGMDDPEDPVGGTLLGRLSALEEKMDALLSDGLQLKGSDMTDDDALPVHVLGETLARINDPVTLNPLPSGNNLIGEVYSLDPYQRAVMEANEIRRGAGIPAGVHIGVEQGVTPGLSDPGALTDSPPIHIANRNDIISRADAGTGSLEDPYVIRNRRFTLTSANTWGFAWSHISPDYYIRLENCEFVGDGTRAVSQQSNNQLTVVHCSFSGVTQEAIFSNRLGGVFARKCLFSACHRGVYAYGGSTITIENCRADDSSGPWTENGSFVHFANTTTQTLHLTHSEIIGGENGPNRGIVLSGPATLETVMHLSHVIGNVRTTFLEVASGNILRDSTLQYFRITGGTKAIWGHGGASSYGRLINVDIGHFEVGPAVSASRLVDFSHSANVKVHHGKFTETSGVQSAGSECLQAWRSTNVEFAYCWVTECSEDAFEFVECSDSLMHHLVGDNAAMQVVDFYGNTVRCVAHHIYGNGGEGVRFTDTVDCAAHHIFCVPAVGESPVILHKQDFASERNSVYGPITHSSLLGEGTPKIRQAGAVGVNYGVYWDDTLEKNVFVGFGQ